MIECFGGEVGTTIPITLAGEIEAIALTSEVPFEFRVVCNHQPADLPLALQELAEWQTLDLGIPNLATQPSIQSAAAQGVSMRPDRWFQR